MDETAGAVADFVAAAFARSAAAATAAAAAAGSLPGGPFLVAVAGVPGSGKTTLAAAVARRLNALAASGPPPTHGVAMGRAFVMPMDGYHLTRAQLDAMPDPATAHARRGAPFTFDPAALRADLLTLQRTGQLSAPGFDHALRDPSPGAIAIDATTTTATTPAEGAGDVVTAPVSTRHVVLVEGLYLCLSAPDEWRAVSDVFDCRVFLAADLDAATERLTQRHMRAWGIGREEAYGRASGSDRLNAELVDAHRGAVDLVVNAVDDAPWAAAAAT